MQSWAELCWLSEIRIGWEEKSHHLFFQLGFCQNISETSGQQRDGAFVAAHEGRCWKEFDSAGTDEAVFGDTAQLEQHEAQPVSEPER